MMWDEILPLWVALLNGDAELVAELGGERIYPAQSARPVEIPSVEYTLPFSDVEEENFNPFTVQMDYWARGVPSAAVIERRIRAITHRDTAREIEGYRLWTQYQDSRSHEYPAELGVVHRSLDFRFTPLRDKYAGIY